MGLKSWRLQVKDNGNAPIFLLMKSAPVCLLILKESQAGHIATVHTLKNAFEEHIGHAVATSTIYRLLHRHQWRKVGCHVRKIPEAVSKNKTLLKKLSNLSPGSP
jgi:hypothetical protein